MEAELLTLGIESKHGKPYHPQTQGKVERFHQTMKKYLAKQPPAQTKKQQRVGDPALSQPDPPHRGGSPYAGWRVILLVAATDVRILGLGGSPLRRLKLDPSRDYQPQP